MDDSIRQALDDFRAYLQRRHYAAHTLANYTLDLQLFFATCPQPLAQVSFRDIERFIDQQYHQGLAPTTLHRRLHALKHFFDYLIEQRRVTGNPVKPSHMVRRGRPQPPLSITAVQKKMERYAQAAGITASCHSLRHTFASNLLEQGTEIVTIKEFLGHASIASSERYARVSNQKVKQEYLRSMQKIVHQSKV